MTIEQTLSIIKPDATRNNVTGAINSLIEKSGLHFIAQKKVYLKKKDAENFYKDHKDKGFFKSLVEYMTSGPVVLQVLEGENAVAKYREIMGATDPALAKEGTIRKLYGKDIGNNAVHGSDSVTSAKHEISYFFSGCELVS